MPPKKNQKKAAASSAEARQSSGLKSKSRDGEILQAFLLSQSSMVSNEDPKAKLAKIQEDILKEEWEDFQFLREVASFGTIFGTKPNLEGNQEHVKDIVRSTMNIVQTYYLVKMVPNEYYNHPLTRVRFF